MSEEYSKEVADAVSTFLTEDDWHFSFNEETGVFRFTLNIKARIRSISYILAVRKNHYIVFAISPLNADNDDPDVMARMNEFINRANYGLNSGNFEFDNDDGEIRYKTFVDCDGVLPSQKVIKDSIYVPAAMFEKYGNGMVSIMFSSVSAEVAAAKCEE